MPSDAQPDMKPRSRDVTDGLEKAAARGMLRAVGMDDDDWGKPQIGVASSWNEITPCNLSLDRLAKVVKEGVFEAGGFPMEFGTISVSDGISMGHEGMHFSLVSREIIADSVETVMMAERLDGSVLLAGCDKSLPGMLMAAARLDLASVFLYAGSIAPGWVKLTDGTEKEVTIIDAFEAVGACKAGTMSEEDLKRIECAIAPGEGACGGMYTANTMASIAEALGMSLPGSAAPPSADRRRDYYAHRSGEAVVNMLRLGITARDILTKPAFENAITLLMAYGGSTNAVLHLLAIAREAEVDLTLEDFNRIGARVPHLADMKPFGKYVMADIDRHGGVPVVLKALLDAGLLHDTDASGWRAWFDATGEQEVAVAEGPVFEDFNLLRAAALAGQGVALCALAIIADDLREERLVQLSDQLIRAEYGYYIVTRRTAEGPPRAVGRFREWLLSTAPTP